MNKAQDITFRGIFVLLVLILGLVLALCSNRYAHGQISGNPYGTYGVGGSSYTRAVAMTVGTPLSKPTRAIAMDCTVTGTAVVAMADGSTTMNITLPVGHTQWPYSVLEVNSSTATCSYYGTL